MIKSVSSSALRNSVLALFAAGSMGATAANINKDNSYVTEPNKTELVSKAGAEALKSNAVQVTTQTEVPVAQNYQQVAAIKKFITNEDDKKYINDLVDNLYKNFGTFLGSVYVQHEMNTMALYSFMTGNTKLLRDNNIAPKFADEIDSYGEDFYKTVKPNSDKVMGWAMEKYTPYFSSKFKFDHNPTADEVLDKIEEILKNESVLTDEEKDAVRIMSNHYRISTLHSAKDTQSRANLIAYKINLYDTYMFWHELRDAGIYNEGYFRRGASNIKSFYLDWMDKVSPNNK